MIEALERIAVELAAEATARYKAVDLLEKGYEPHHRTYRKEIEPGLYICFREAGDYFEFACVMRYEE